MVRKPRVEFAGATYHVMCRGNRQEAIFTDDKDCERFLDTLGEVDARTGWLVHACVLMGNHYICRLRPRTRILWMGCDGFKVPIHNGLIPVTRSGSISSVLPVDDGEYL